MQIGKVITDWRRQNNINIRDASELLGIPISTLSRVERGRAIEASTLARLLEFLLKEEVGCGTDNQQRTRAASDQQGKRRPVDSGKGAIDAPRPARRRIRR